MRAPGLLVRQAWSHPAESGAEVLENVVTGMSIAAKAFVAKMSGSRRGCP